MKKVSLAIALAFAASFLFTPLASAAERKMDKSKPGAESMGTTVITGIVVKPMERKEEKNIKPGVVKAWRLGNSNYCHLKFPPIRPRTLFSNNPQLADPEFTRLIDYYGPCDHDPLGEVEIEKQRDNWDNKNLFQTE